MLMMSGCGARAVLSDRRGKGWYNERYAVLTDRRGMDGDTMSDALS
ncbi:MAG: hypothetical protein ACXWPS_23260 [Ktedonobacteraceae bacterium]